MPTNHTPNYQLSQWERDDRILMEDFNADNAKIDAAIAGHEGRVAALEQQAPHWGNCQVYAAEYKGSGEYGEEHPNTLTFPKKPVLITIFNSNGRAEFRIFPNSTNHSYSTPTRDYQIYITWSGNTVSWYATDVSIQMNYRNETYHVVAFFAMD